MEESDADAARRKERKYDPERRKQHHGKGDQRDRDLCKFLDRSFCETIDRDRKNAHDNWTNAVEGISRRRKRAECNICRCEYQHDQKRRQHKAKASENTARQSRLGVPDKYAKLSCARSGQHVHKREALDKLRLVDPPTLFLDLRLHDSHDGRSTIAHGANLQEETRYFSQTDLLLVHFKLPRMVTGTGLPQGRRQNEV